MLDRQASRLEVVANTALPQADTLAQRCETKRQPMARRRTSAWARSAKARSRTEEHRDNMLAADQAMSERTQEMAAP